MLQGCNMSWKRNVWVWILQAISRNFNKSRGCLTQLVDVHLHLAIASHGSTWWYTTGKGSWTFMDYAGGPSQSFASAGAGTATPRIPWTPPQPTFVPKKFDHTELWDPWYRILGSFFHIHVCILGGTKKTKDCCIICIIPIASHPETDVMRLHGFTNEGPDTQSRCSQPGPLGWSQQSGFSGRQQPLKLSARFTVLYSTVFHL